MDVCLEAEAEILAILSGRRRLFLDEIMKPVLAAKSESWDHPPQIPEKIGPIGVADGVYAIFQR